ncbi:MAG: putative alcohol dehydrogenase, zinc-containing [Ilumatobacteraceae bacterium]|nr:putative alcohol dehydrogenase, zinc-containing [Ilumatobacteraceae bacterium]
MRAARAHAIGAPDDVVWVDEVDVPGPGAGQALLRVQAAALNLPDAMLCRGTYPLAAPLPFTAGLDAGGVIESVGPGVDNSIVGHRVTAVPELPHGGFAEFAIVNAGRLFEVPAAVSMRDAVAAQIIFQTAHVALHHRGRLAPGETVLVLGAAGGVGLATIQLAKLAGAKVIAVAGGADKGEACRSSGADHVVDHTTGPIGERVMELTDGRGVEVVVDPVGGTASDAARRCLVIDGRLLVVGFASGDTPRFNGGSVLRSSISVIGVYMGAYSKSPEGRQFVDLVHAELMAMLGDGRITAPISRVIGLTDVAAALADLEARTVIGKIVVDPAI